MTRKKGLGLVFESPFFSAVAMWPTVKMISQSYAFLTEEIPVTDDLKSVLTTHKRVAVYGMSKNPEKAAHRVPAFLISHGYDVVPVNPSADTILERTCYDTLLAVEGRIDLVNVFRPSEAALDVVREAVERKRAKGDIAVIWLQEGIVNEEAKNLAEENGIRFVQDRCMLKEYKKAFGM